MDNREHQHTPSRPNLLSRVIRDGGPGFCQFAITDACNARCSFCNFSIDSSDQNKHTYVPLSEAKRAIAVLSDNGVEYVAFVGGEPTMHADLPEMLTHAKSLGLHTIVCTNGMLLSHKRREKYVQAGLDSLLISIDAPSVDTHEQNRGLPGVCARIAESNRYLHSAGVNTTASVTISRLLGDIQKLPGFLKSLHFDSVTFSYPLRSLPSTYKSYSDSELVEFSDVELLSIFEQIKGLKKQIRVVNPTASLEEMQRFLRGEKQMFPCLAGCKYFHLDWNFDLYRCHAWHEPMCSVFDLDPSKLVRDGCMRCMIDCYRDSSVLHYLGMALHDAGRDVANRDLKSAAARLLNKSAYQAGLSLLENLRWIRKL